MARGIEVMLTPYHQASDVLPRFLLAIACRAMVNGVANIFVQTSKLPEFLLQGIL